MRFCLSLTPLQARGNSRIARAANRAMHLNKNDISLWFKNPGSGDT